MAICIRTELQRTNEILLAIAGIAKQGIDDGIRITNEAPHWTTAIELLADLALTELGQAEERINLGVSK
jgi:hypothetical protein